MTTTRPNFLCRQSEKIEFVREQIQDTGLNVYYPDLNFYLHYYEIVFTSQINPCLIARKKLPHLDQIHFSVLFCHPRHHLGMLSCHIL